MEKKAKSIENKKIDNLKARIFIRLEKSQKSQWKSICRKKNISLTSLIINAVDNRIMDDERRRVLLFIEKQDNIFAKIENNINQVARYVNGQKFISISDVKTFNEKLILLSDLRKQQNEIFERIYSLLANDS
ncbi:hypothetical protein [Chryseobacterium potabilaquae]|uniref:Mobilisation protein (MobC) n=1 Tax=Chryseobacterium potabilaquae TaxID=2675057 RepID=A0A6N4X8B3_9FLAO|nr:hypothetical protein [Chryseobacterium potabilaquae]CAA7197008.1 hypothetical protein CHRY9293_03066 [Chryseobacterium potabilaquae]